MSERGKPPSLPGSLPSAKGPAPVTNGVLMPSSKKLPGQAPASAKKSTSAPPVHLLGSGGKIPESYETKMLHQFSIPDPLSYGKKKKEVEIQRAPTSEVRSSISISSYKTATPTKDGKPSSPLVAKEAARQAAQEKAKAAAETKRLMGMKEALLSNVCNDPNATFYDYETRRVQGIVTDINKKLGLPIYDTGRWKLPD